MRGTHSAKLIKITKARLSGVVGWAVETSTKLDENTLEPALAAAGIKPVDQASIPYFLEHQASAIAYFSNVAKGNVFPASSCYRVMIQIASHAVRTKNIIACALSASCFSRAMVGGGELA